VGLVRRLPDAENFLFLLYGESQAATRHGNNTATNQNPDSTTVRGNGYWTTFRQAGSRRQISASCSAMRPGLRYNPYAGSVNHAWLAT